MKKIIAIIREQIKLQKLSYLQLKELEWANVYHDSIRGHTAIEQLPLNIGRWAGNYAFFYILNSIIIDTSNRVVNLAWEPQENVQEYFIYVQWNSGDWQYYAKTSQTNYSIVYGVDKEYINVAVQTNTIPLERFSNATLFENEGSLI